MSRSGQDVSCFLKPGLLGWMTAGVSPRPPVPQLSFMFVDFNVSLFCSWKLLRDPRGNVQVGGWGAVFVGLQDCGSVCSEFTLLTDVSLMVGVLGRAGGCS